MQKGESCIDDDTVKDPPSHVTCCCGYHPFSSFGEITRVTIDGITSVPKPGRVTGKVPQWRRLDVKEPPNVSTPPIIKELDFVDVCASGWTDAMTAVGEIYAR